MIMIFVSQLVSLPLIFLIRNSLVSGWTNEPDRWLLNVIFENQTDIQKVYYLLKLYELVIYDSFYNLNNIGRNETDL